jgi:hypothetical protein
MATRASLGAKIHEAMTRTNEIIEEHAPGHMGRMRPLTTTGTPPVRTTNADEITRVVAYQAEQNLALAEIVHEIAKAERNRKRAAERERKAAARKDAAA